MKIDTKNDSLDTLCSNHPTKYIEMSDCSIVSDAYAKIEKEKKDKIERLEEYVAELVFDQTTAYNLKQLTRFQRINAPSKTMRICNTVPIQKINSSFDTVEHGENLTLRVNEYGYGMSGLNRCKNPFCTMCSRSRAGERAHKLKNGIIYAQTTGKHIYFVTLTIPRHKDIAFQLKEIRRRWGAINNMCSHLKRDYDCNIYKARAMDVTFNPVFKSQRYHLHIHAIIITDVEIDGIEDKIARTWINQNTPNCRAQYNCQDVQKVKRTMDDSNRVGKYVAKMAGLANEITHGQMKESKSHSSVTLSELMLQRTHDSRSLHLGKCIEIYTEFLLGMKRVRTLNISRNWDDLKPEILEEMEKPFTVELEISIDRWNLLKANWFYIAEKVQFEVFQNSFYGGTKTLDIYRVNQVVEDIEEMIDSMERRSHVFDIACHQFDY